MSNGAEVKLGLAQLPVIAHDNDPSGFKCNLNKAYQARAGMRILYLPKRTPELMPWDFSLWKAVTDRMTAFELSQSDEWREPVETYKARLEATARGLPVAVVLECARDVGNRARKIAEVHGKHING